MRLVTLRKQSTNKRKTILRIKITNWRWLFSILIPKANMEIWKKIISIFFESDVTQAYSNNFYPKWYYFHSTNILLAKHWKKFLWKWKLKAFSKIKQALSSREQKWRVNHATVFTILQRICLTTFNIWTTQIFGDFLLKDRMILTGWVEIWSINKIIQTSKYEASCCSANGDSRKSTQALKIIGRKVLSQCKV